MKRSLMLVLFALLMIGSVTTFAADHLSEYKTAEYAGTLSLKTGTSCNTDHSYLSGSTTNCGDRYVLVYRILTDDGWEYQVQPGIWNPLSTILPGSKIKYRIEGEQKLWTPCDMVSSPTECKHAKIGHEAKYIISSISKREEIMTNADVIGLAKLGLSDSVIIAKIASTKGEYDTSMSALKDLKISGVSDAVIAQIMSAK